jgi:ApbE superfamily uncharacterized protein (UPF0280 family)
VSQERHYQSFTHREAVFRICCSKSDAVMAEILRQRDILEGYIEQHPLFRHALEPIALRPDAPEVAQRMAHAADLVGVGPMAAVAGVMAQLAAQAGLDAGAPEAIVENGGDIYLRTLESVTVGLYPGTAELTEKLAFSLEAADTPLAICSSSGRMGPSMSRGACDLAAVTADDAALADAAATQAANLVRTVKDVNPALERIAAIAGVKGVMIVKQDQVGLAGQLPRLVKIR